MDIQRVWAVYFSPTGNTRAVVSAMAEEAATQWGAERAALDLTLPQARVKEYTFTGNDLVFFGVPTYAGKTPNKLLPFLQSNLQGGGALAVGVVTFGGRSYDNALAELCAVLTAEGFCTVGAAAFVGRHAFSDALAFGRPSRRDLDQARRMGEQISVKLKSFTGDLAAVTPPGAADAPYYTPLGTDGQPAKFLKAKPQTDMSRCCGCGVCARVCPMGAIDPANVALVPGTCIKCQACVRRCTRGAKFFDDPAFLSHVAMLEREFAEADAENEVFL